MFYVYVLRLSDNSFYKGQTQDIDKRLTEHNTGNVKTTKNNMPFKLVHVEICEKRVEARNLEKYFKSGSGREIIKEIAEVTEWQTYRT